MPLNQLSRDVLHLIARNLNAVELSRLAQTNKTLSEVANNPLLPAQHDRLNQRFIHFKKALKTQLDQFQQSPSQQVMVVIENNLNDLASDISLLPDPTTCAVQ